MSIASAQVIAHRTSRLAAAGPLPNASDRQEFTRMGQEKFEAATASVHAIAAHAVAMNLEFGASMFRLMVTGTAAFVSLAGSRTVEEFNTRYTKLAETLSHSAQTTAELYRSATQLARRGLKPIHARATANARRLGKR
jgi:hypothetical protein